MGIKNQINELTMAKFKEWLEACPMAEMTEVTAVYDDGDVLVVTVDLAIEKEV